ncbi:MAG: PEP-CTERM sorting domain-containing protein [Kiloniellales bacterium]|nr:PEP-CTERM sorting domain-containing protein [Kiloniellales bacterium]
MDPGTPGIQSALTVAPQTTFNVDVVISDDGNPNSPFLFQEIVVEVLFNNAGPLLTLGPTGPLAGALAATVGTLDAGSGFVPTAPGAALGADPSIAPTAGFADGTGGLGLANGTPPTFFTVGPGPAISVFSLQFTAGMLTGTSTLLPSGNGGLPLIFFESLPVASTPVAGQVTVIPEPGTLALFAVGLGMIGVAASRRQRRRANA